VGHDHGHSHEAPDHSRAFAVGIGLNLAFVTIEVIYGVLSHSMSLVADAGHNFGDVLGLGLAWGATILAKRRPSARRTYGYRRTTILAALANAVLLLAATGIVMWESILRLRRPEPVHGMTMMIVAGVGVGINALAAWLFASGRKGDLNIRSAFLHLAGDAAISLGVLVAGLVIYFTHWDRLDPLVSLALSFAILASTWSLLRSSLNLSLDAVPEGIDPNAVRDYLAGLPGVTAIHDLHIWPLSTTDVALTAHLVMPGQCHPRFLVETCKVLHDRFEIEHATLQIDPAASADECRLAPEGAV
jgi:cobalt-zinc-cadmium efflux system protein